MNTAWLLIVFGLVIRYQIGRRRFNRRSLTGMQVYRNYLAGLLTSFLETIIHSIGALCIVAGLFKLLF